MRLLAAAAALGILLPGAPAQEWPGWRGANRDGSAPGLAAPGVWPERLERKWKVTVGEGHSSPVVSAGVVYLLARRGENEVAAALSAATGKPVWQQSYPAPYEMNSAATGHGRGPKSTSAVDGSKLYTLGISGILSAFEAGTGKLAWRKEFSRQFRTTSPLYGTAMSPLVDRGLLIAHAGGHDDGALMAFDANSGEARWSWKGDGPGYASPVIVELAGVRQLVTQTQKKIIGIDPAAGGLLWEIPFTTPWDQNVVTPLVYGDLLIVSGLSSPATAYRFARKGGRLVPAKIWENRDAEMYMSSPVVAGKWVFGFAKRYRGRFFCLDPATGKTVWAGEPRSGDYASIVAAGETLLMLTEHGELAAARAGQGKVEILRRYTVADSPTWAHLAPARGGVLVKDFDSLALWTW